MVQIDKLLKSVSHRPDVIFTSSYGDGSDIIYIPETGNISTFFNTQKLNTKATTDSIVIPNRLTIAGKTIINNVAYTKMKAAPEFKGFDIFKTIQKLKSHNKTRYIDTSFFIKEVISLAHTRSITMVLNEFFKYMFSLYSDIDRFNQTGTAKNELKRLKLLLIDLDLSSTQTGINSSGFTKDFLYYLQINKYQLDANKLEHLPDAIIYKIGANYFTIGMLETFPENPERNYVKINRVQLENVIKVIDSNSMDSLSSSKNKELTKDKILGFKDAKNLEQIIVVGNDIGKLHEKYKDDYNKLTQEVKKYVEGNPLLSDLEGTTFQEKLQNLYYGMSHAEKLQAQRGVKNEVDPEKEENLKTELSKSELSDTNTKIISKLTEQEKLIVKKYNGTIFLEEMQERDNLGIRAFNPDNIVKLTEFSGYKKQETEFQNNLDDAIEDLVMSMEKDKELGIKVHGIKSEIKDTHRTRFKRFTVQISHPNFGDTFKGKYSFTMDVPYPDDKYNKFGGNDYIMVNQLFNKPIQKVNNQLVRLYTHYNTTSVTLKNSKFNGVYGLQNLEKELMVSLKNWAQKNYPGNPMILESMGEEASDIFKNIPIARSALAKMNYKKIVFKGAKQDYFKLDFTVLKNSDQPEKTEKTENFYEFRDGNLEYARFNIPARTIEYHVNGDTREFPIEHLDEFLMGMYNRISKVILKRDSIKKSKTSTPYFSVKIIGYQCPISILLTGILGFNDAMVKMNLKWSFQDKKLITKEKDQDLTGIGGEPINIQFQNGYVTIYPKTMKQRSLANGFLKYKVKTSNFNLTENSNPFINALENDFGSYGLKKLLEAIPKIIDNTTEKILKEYGYPTDVLDLYSDTIPNMMLTREDSHFENLDYYRIRLSETISHIGYNQIQQALSELKRKKNFKDTKLFLKSEFIMSKLLEAGLFQNAKTINPIEEMMLSQKIVKTGIGNVKKGQVTLARRDLNQSYFGVISPTATNEYGGIGSNQTLTNGTTIKDRFGTIKTKAYNNEDNPFNMLAPVESLTPFFERDDTTRRIMGNQQTGQFTQLENPDEPLVQTGFESYIPWLVSDRFTKKARIQGKIEFTGTNKSIMKIIGTGPDIGKTQIVNMKHSKSRTKRGVYLLNKYTPLVSEGQNVKPSTILAATDSLKSGKLAVGKNLVVAEMPYNGMNYEDGWAISNSLTTKYSNKYLQKITMLIPDKVKVTKINIAKNQVTKAGDVLLEFQKENYHIQNLELDTEHEDSDDVLYGLEQHRGTSKYFSPGGKILEIQVKLNNPKPDTKIKTLWDESIKDLNALQSFCELQSKNETDPKAKNKSLMDCMGSADGISTLSIGGHKIGGEEPGTGIIEVYIERDNPISNGSKFTLGNSGGKGTVQYIIPEGKEPIAIESQLKIDFIPTSLSIIKRKNPSIIFNMYLGKCMFFINEMIKQMLKDKPDDIKRIENFVLSCYEIIDKTKDTRILDEFRNFFKQDKSKIQRAINQSNSLQRPLFVGLVPAFSNEINMRDIVRLSKHIGIPLKERVLVKENSLDDDQGTITMKKVPVGILNVFLLEHFPQTQGSVRGSMYVKRSIVTGQGQSGSKDRKGATKAGLYDLYSILTKSPYHLVKELHSLKSDAKMAKIAYDREIFNGNGVPSIADIKISKHDTTTKNYLEALFLSAGIKAVY